MDNTNYVRPIASDLIRDERQKQRAKGYDAAHDDQHGDGELAQAAVVYAMDALGIASAEFSVAPGIAVAIDHYGMLWPFERKAWRPETPVRDLIKAAALLSAEIDRRLRAGDPWL